MRSVTLLVGTLILTAFLGSSPAAPVNLAYGPVADTSTEPEGGSETSTKGAPRPRRTGVVADTDRVRPLPKLSAEQLKAVAWTRDQFLAVGLVAPRVKFVFHDDTRRCRLRRGLFCPKTRTIEICNLNRETLVHEMAHAWVDSNVSEDVRTEFTRRRGLAVWNDHSVPWADRAIEHAAEIIAWGVEQDSRLISWIEPDGRHILRLLTIPDSTPEELAAAYQHLVGIPAHPARLHARPTLQPTFSPEARSRHGG